jgi:hypothetical protein
VTESLQVRKSRLAALDHLADAEATSRAPRVRESIDRLLNRLRRLLNRLKYLWYQWTGGAWPDQT